MLNQYEKLKDILREMFQMDQADLDFGIYRIMNAKRDEIEKFLDGVASSPAVVGDVVYVGSYGGYVYALNAISGEQLWNYTTPFLLCRLLRLLAA